MKNKKIRHCERPKGAKQSPWMRGDCFVVLTSSALLAMTILVPFCFADEQAQKFPFIGRINQDNVNIRAGNNQNFEILSKVNTGDLVFVTEESYGWYKVRLPKSAHLYAAKDFIEKKEDGAVSKAGSLNLRARPNKESSIICQIKKGGPVTIAAEDAQDWYEILPPTGSYGWIKSDLVSYSSSDIIKWEEEQEPSKKVEKPAPVAQGEVQNMGFTFRKRPGSHKLALDKKSIYYLRSDKCNLKSYEGEMVYVWGDIMDLGTDKLVIDVSEIVIARNYEQKRGVTKQTPIIKEIASPLRGSQ